MRGVGAKGNFFTLLADVELTKETFTGEMHQNVSLLLTMIDTEEMFLSLKMPLQ